MQQCKIVINVAVAAAMLVSRVILYTDCHFYHFYGGFRVGASRLGSCIDFFGFVQCGSKPVGVGFQDF